MLLIVGAIALVWATAGTVVIGLCLSAARGDAAQRVVAAHRPARGDGQLRLIA